MANLDREMIVSNHVDFDDLYDRAYLESTLQCCYFFLLLYVCGFFSPRPHVLVSRLTEFVVIAFWNQSLLMKTFFSAFRGAYQYGIVLPSIVRKRSNCELVLLLPESEWLHPLMSFSVQRVAQNKNDWFWLKVFRWYNVTKIMHCEND